MVILRGNAAREALREIINAKKGYAYPPYPPPFVMGFYEEDGITTAFDNRDAHCWVDDFYNRANALNWLNNSTVNK